MALASKYEAAKTKEDSHHDHKILESGTASNHESNVMIVSPHSNDDLQSTPEILHELQQEHFNLHSEECFADDIERQHIEKLADDNGVKRNFDKFSEVKIHGFDQN